jgi:hypothetical protein
MPHKPATFFRNKLGRDRVVSPLRMPGRESIMIARRELLTPGFPLARNRIEAANGTSLGSLDGFSHFRR